MTDRFRSKYRELTDAERISIEEIKTTAEKLEQAIERARQLDRAGGRELALATTKLEESVMWAIKGVTG